MTAVKCAGDETERLSTAGIRGLVNTPLILTKDFSSPIPLD